MLINSLEKNHSIIKMLRFKNFVLFVQNVFNDIAWNYGNVAVKDFQKNEKLECKKNKLNSDINFLNNWKQIGIYPKLLIFKLPNISIKHTFSINKDSFVVPPVGVKSNSNIYQKISVYLKAFHLRNFLPLTSTFLQNLWHGITRDCSRNRYTLNKKSCLHLRGKQLSYNLS